MAMSNVVNLFTKQTEVSNGVSVESLKSCNVTISTAFEILFAVRDHYSKVAPNKEIRAYINALLAKSILEDLDHPQCPESVYDLFVSEVKPAIALVLQENL
jgi:hypothetical protein